MKKDLSIKGLVLGIIILCIGMGAYLIYETYFLNTNAIDTTASFISPYNQTSSPITLSATGPSDLSNVTLYYRFNSENKTRKYMTGVSVTNVTTFNLNYPNAITSINGTAFIASFKTRELVVYNVTNSSSMTFISSKYDGNRTLKIESTEATSDGKYCYTLTRNGIYKSVISVYNATNTSSLSLMTYRVLPTNCQGMYLEMDEEENFLFATGDFKICVYNITNKKSGQLDYIDAINLKGILPTGIVWKIHVVGDTLYAPCGYHTNTSMRYKGLRIYDITDRSNPVYKNSLNWSTTYGWDCQIFTHTNGYQYLVFAGISQLTPYHRAKINLYNISAGNATHPVFMYTMNICDSGGNCSNSFGVVYNDYLFLRNENKNVSRWNNGFWVYNFTDINNPTNFTRLSGDGSPRYLEAIHYIEGDKNGSDRSIYMLSMNDDSLISINPTWVESLYFSDSWKPYGNPDTYPYEWSFDFPNGTGYYQFYTLGRKVGYIDEIAPLTYDTHCFFETID